MLSKAAYLPREFTVIVEKGNFAAVRDYSGQRELRMTFDTSPYPTREGYNHERRSGLTGDDIFETLSSGRSFYANKLPHEMMKVRATEDDTVMGCHTSICVML